MAFFSRLFLKGEESVPRAPSAAECGAALVVRVLPSSVVDFMFQFHFQDVHMFFYMYESAVLVVLLRPIVALSCRFILCCLDAALDQVSELLFC